VAQRPRVVIVGGGFGGLYAAKSFRGVPVDVTLIDKESQRPPAKPEACKRWNRSKRLRL
jgi:NADH dehydrogenase FAD-containing subunit